MIHFLVCLTGCTTAIRLRRNLFNQPRRLSMPDAPHLAQLVVQSKKALQHAEQLCQSANTAAHDSSNLAVDVLALDAKVKWITEGVLEQFRVLLSLADWIYRISSEDTGNCPGFQGARGSAPTTGG